MAKTPDVDAIALVIGERDMISDGEAATRMAKKVAEVLKEYPGIPVIPSIFGYDHTTVELWEIPEVCVYVQVFFGMMHVLGVPLNKWCLCNDSRAWIGRCMWPEDTALGLYTTAFTQRQLDYLGYDQSVDDKYHYYVGGKHGERRME